MTSRNNTETGILVRQAEDLTPAWATRVLACLHRDDRLVVTDIRVEVIGTGQMGRVLRVTLAYLPGISADAPTSIIVKIASPFETSRATGRDSGIYEAEVVFYRDLASGLSVSVPRCHAAVYENETGHFTLVFDDLSETTKVGDVLAGGSVEQARLALKELARMQASCWNAPTLRANPILADTSRLKALFDGYVTAAPPFIADLGEEMTAAKIALIERAMPAAPRWLAETPGPFVVQHGDYRLDNMLFGISVEAPPLTILDWQTVRLGAPLVDAAYYLSGCLTVEERRANEHALLLEYHDTLREFGIRDYAWDRLWQDYRRASLYGLFMGVGAYSLVTKSERGKAIIGRSVSKRADHVLDLDGADFLS